MDPRLVIAMLLTCFVSLMGQYRIGVLHGRGRFLVPGMADMHGMPV